ncbi:PD-(D/E)XK nuclease family protein [Methylobacterium sp. J-026]|uniref:PD-(D/E)XK nuclease family protein n=1 Tax=Methylobacterium sp. J-026 TaxID=2836624 RepID=UPI001FBA8C07|nr:PD-(D/E)XK nuclease family protein [Methylobacterium sp. J-026]MCJ2135620.1 PD-(D/E)XK nuclease family protein [Methylobacterium sp. J-026]
MDIIDHPAGLVVGPGLFRMPADVYHSDPAPEPSLSSSLAKVLVEKSAEHAYAMHPRLGRAPDAEDAESSRAMQTGTAAHRLILGAGAELVVVDADDWRTKAAKEARAAAVTAGKAPVLRLDHATAATLARRVTGRLARVPDCEGFFDAPAEVVGIVRHPSGAWLRAMFDRIEVRRDRIILWDVKTGQQSAAPQDLGRRIEGMAMEVQAALYVDVAERLFPRMSGRVSFRWVFCENEAPNAVTVAEIDAATLHIGRRKLAVALHRWNEARTSDVWPGYPAEIIRPEFPDWAAKRWGEREGEPTLARVNFDLNASPFRPLDWDRAA